MTANMVSVHWFLLYHTAGYLIDSVLNCLVLGWVMEMSHMVVLVAHIPYIYVFQNSISISIHY